MGGIVSSPQSCDVIPQRSVAMSCRISVETAPLLNYREILRGLFFCKITWEHLCHSRVGNHVLLDILHAYVLEALHCFDNNSGNTTALKIECLLEESKRLRGNDPIAFALSFILKLNRAKSERSLSGRLRVLGREHARLGVDATMLVVFCNAVLIALQHCLSDHPDIIDILFAWSTTFKYILKEMCSIRYSFQRAECCSAILITNNSNNNSNSSRSSGIAVDSNCNAIDDNMKENADERERQREEEEEEEEEGVAGEDNRDSDSFGINSMSRYALHSGIESDQKNVNMSSALQLIEAMELDVIARNHKIKKTATTHTNQLLYQQQQKPKEGNKLLQESHYSIGSCCCLCGSDNINYSSNCPYCLLKYRNSNSNSNSNGNGNGYGNSDGVIVDIDNVSPNSVKERTNADNSIATATATVTATATATAAIGPHCSVPLIDLFDQTTRTGISSESPREDDDDVLLH